MSNHNRKLLAVLAHPDDESFGMGGTLAYYATQGVQVSLICATRGEVGEVPPENLKAFNTIAELREHELYCAAEKLGLTDVHFLDYRDSGMPGSPDNQHPNALTAQPVELVAEKIAKQIRQIKPQVVITFDPLGGYRHPDHIAIHRATVLAFEKSSDLKFRTENLPPYTPERLYYHVMPKASIRMMIKVMRLLGKDPQKWGSNKDIDLLSIAEAEFPIHARINIRSVINKKEAAAACHDSQGGGLFLGRLTKILMRLAAGEETFMQAFPPVLQQGSAARDLFE